MTERTHANSQLELALPLAYACLLHPWAVEIKKVMSLTQNYRTLYLLCNSNNKNELVKSTLRRTVRPDKRP